MVQILSNLKELIVPANWESFPIQHAINFPFVQSAQLEKLGWHEGFAGPGNWCFQGPRITRVLVPSLFISFAAWHPACARCNRFQSQRMPSSSFSVEEYSVGDTAAAQQDVHERKWSKSRPPRSRRVPPT